MGMALVSSKYGIRGYLNRLSTIASKQLKLDTQDEGDTIQTAPIGVSNRIDAALPNAALFSIPSPMTRDEIESEIAHYEELFGMSSEEFLQKRNAGLAPDNFEAMDWFTLIKHRK